MMAPVADPVYHALAEYLTRATGLRVEVDHARPWWERERQLDRGEAHLGAICGLPYAWKADRPAPALELLAAPVMLARRYRGRPVYYSDVVVRRESPFRSFADLRGASWAYNEPASHSGYYLTRYALARRREFGGYFGRVVQAGAHERALQL